jgi:hypothetical protein
MHYVQEIQYLFWLSEPAIRSTITLLVILVTCPDKGQIDLSRYYTQFPHDNSLILTYPIGTARTYAWIDDQARLGMAQPFAA